jgi:hypothetical protein
MKHSRPFSLFATSLAIAAAVGCTTDPSDEPLDADAPEEGAACVVPPVDIDRSLFVSPTQPPEQGLLRSRFAVSRIMSHILASSGAARPASGAELFGRWWDTQNATTNAVFPDNPHCDDNGRRINGFPVSCARNEGRLATLPPDSHFPVALVYRPDLAAADGSTCGQARIVIAKPADPGGRNVAIFESAIPNPEPGCGLAGCRKIAQFWAGLSSVDSFPQRLDALERFYFHGLDPARDGVATAPALDAANLGLPDATGARQGQIRTNQFMTGPNPQVWQLREFQLARSCASPGGCKLFFEPVSVKTNPWGFLFNDRAPEPLGPAFRDELIGQIPALAVPDVNAIGMSFSAVFDAGQSNSQGPENRYLGHFGLGDPNGLRREIGDAIAALDLPLTPEDIVARATTQSCGGCHQLSNNAPLGGLDPQGNPLRWPPSAGFVHVLENGQRSPALNGAFLPRRRQILEQFLRDHCPGTCAAPAAAASADPTPISGRAAVH